jgi:hypothetical protein
MFHDVIKPSARGGEIALASQRPPDEAPPESGEKRATETAPP